jgi:hypothetical protein
MIKRAEDRTLFQLSKNKHLTKHKTKNFKLQAAITQNNHIYLHAELATKTG